MKKQNLQELEWEELKDDFYNEEEIEILLEDDEISTIEEAFMRGYIGEEWSRDSPIIFIEEVI